MKDMNLPFFICGEVSCGKSTFAKKLASQLKYKIIEISDIVKKISKNKEADLSELDQLIIDELKLLFKEHNNKLIIVGVNQVSVLEAFERGKLELFPIYYWMEIPREVRVERHLNDKNNTLASFQLNTALDNKAGIRGVKAYCLDYRNQIEAELSRGSESNKVLSSKDQKAADFVNSMTPNKAKPLF